MELLAAAAAVSTVADLAAVLRQLRRRQARDAVDTQLTYRELAAKAGWSHGIVGEYLAGRVLPPTDRFDVLVRLLGATPVEQGALATARDRVEEQRRDGATNPRPVDGDWLVVGRPPGEAAAARERPALAEAVDAALADPDVRQVLLIGAGGTGKSQLAAAAFHRARTQAAVRLWVPASTQASVLTGYARAWRALHGRPDLAGSTSQGGDEQTQADLFLAWLRTAERTWLVVLDDIADPADLAGLWPAGERGHTLLTTRRRDAALLRPASRSIEVGLFEPAESLAYLRERLGTTGPELSDLAAAIGHFPLALSQAAAVILDTGIDAAGYRELLADQRQRLTDLFPATSPADEHHDTVAGTWRLALDRAEALAPPGTARAMLDLAAVLDPTEIPEVVLFSRSARRWSGAGSMHQARLAVRALHRLSLVTHDAPAVRVHALVQRAAREALPAGGLAAVAVAAADAIEEVWSDPDLDETTQAGLAANLAALRQVAEGPLWTDRMHPVLRRPAQRLIDTGRATAGLACCADLIDAARRHGLADDHRDRLVLLAQQAEAYCDLGDADRSVELATEAAAAAHQRYGAHDRDTLTVRRQLISCLIDASEFAQASAAATALAADATATLGAGHPLTLDARRSAGSTAGLGGDPHRARQEMAVLLDDALRSLGPRHLITMLVQSELARWVGETGTPAEAVARYEEAVAGLSEGLGRLHLRTLAARQNLAYWRGLAGDPQQAAAEFTVAARDAEIALGPRDLTTLTIRANRAYWHGLAGDPAGGRVELTAVLADVEQRAGVKHPRTLRIRMQRTRLSYATGDRQAALAELVVVHAELVRIQGPQHPWCREAADLIAAWRAAGTSLR